MGTLINAHLLCVVFTSAQKRLYAYRELQGPTVDRLVILATRTSGFVKL